ncbi:MAG: hypothetical protein DBY31_02290 [Succinivibrio sp.]|nr:MAG: hypothetical protein DBY31_02290 [Succinivibrio sp.]
MDLKCKTCCLRRDLTRRINNLMFQGYDLKHFFKFIIPSILAFTILGVYSVVDGFFVGNAIGDAGVSAINVVFPAVALTFALGSVLV